MAPILALLVCFLAIGLGARRFSWRAHVVLVVGIVAMLVFELISLNQL